MKKSLFILLTIIFSFNVQAQIEGEAVNFTFTNALDEQSITLFDILDGGQYVYLEFFRTTCPLCQNAAPLVANAYRKFGCNEGELFIIGISGNDPISSLKNWAAQHNTNFPLVTHYNIYNYYQVDYQPWGILIAPDHHIVSNNLNPNYLYDAALYYGIHEAEDQCPVINNTTAISEIAAEEIAIFPNPASDFIKISGAEMDVVEIFNAYGQKVIAVEPHAFEVTISTAELRSGVYFVKINDQKVQKFMKM